MPSPCSDHGSFLQRSLASPVPLVLHAQGPPPPKLPHAANEKKSPVVKTGDSTYEMGGVQFNSATREIRIPTIVNMNEGVIEYALVTDTGKTHESLLSTKVRPFDVNVAMLLCHYEPHAGRDHSNAQGADSGIARRWPPRRWCIPAPTTCC